MSAYVIGQLKISDPERYQKYLDGFMPSFKRHGGEVLASTRKETQVLEGSWTLPRTVILRFPDLESANAWYNDPEYQELCEIRRESAETNLVVIEGV